MTKKPPPPNPADLLPLHNELALDVQLLTKRVDRLAAQITEVQQRLEAVLDVNVDDMEQD